MDGAWLGLGSGLGLGLESGLGLELGLVLGLGLVGLAWGWKVLSQLLPLSPEFSAAPHLRLERFAL